MSEVRPAPESSLSVPTTPAVTPALANKRRMEPVCADWRSFSWATGTFDMGWRPPTAEAEGVVCMPQHLVIVTLRGGARHQEVRAACGHRFSGPDRSGAVSFVPAFCDREVKLSGIESRWASVALKPALLDEEAVGAQAMGRVVRSLDLPTFSNCDDRFLAGVVAELAHFSELDGRLDPLQGEQASLLLARYLLRRYGRSGDAGHARRLPPWRVRRIVDHVEAYLDQDIRIADLAREVGVSAGYLHRAFRESTGRTPLEFVNERRVRRAQHILETEPASMADIALRIGFQSPSHFSRIFRAITGCSPSRYRTLTAAAGELARRSFPRGA